MSKAEYPSLPDLSHANTFHIQQKNLKDLLYRTSFAVSKEDNRYVLTGVLMHITNAQATFVGTDGKRLARAHIPIEITPTFVSQSIIPLKAVDEILKNLTEEGDAKISLMPDKIAIQTNQTLLLTKLLAVITPILTALFQKTLTSLYPTSRRAHNSSSTNLPFYS